MYRSDKRPRIALIYGGEGKEHDVSLLGKDYLAGLIDPGKYLRTDVLIDRLGAWYIVDREKMSPTFPVRLGDKCGLLSDKGVLRIDCAIPLLHGDRGEDGRVQGLLECANIPFIGADTATGAIAADKDYTKRIAESLGIPVARGVRIPRGTPLSIAREMAESLGYPLFLKPTGLGSSVGAYEVPGEERLEQIYDGAMALGSDLMLEELIEDKRELEVAFFSALGRVILTHPGEPECVGTYGFSEKYGGSTTVSDRAEVSEEIAEKIADYSAILAGALKLRHLARIDFFLSGERLLFNEVNSFPGFTAESLYPRLMARAGIAPDRLIDMMLEDCLLDRRI